MNSPVPGDFVPVEGSLAAVEWIDGDGGEQNVCYDVAEWRNGEWWPINGGHRFLRYEGSSISAIWPMTPDRKIEIEELVHVWDPKVEHKD